MKKLTTALCAVLLMILVLMPGAAAAGPALSATRAYCIIDADTGLVLAQQNMNEELHPASITKVMTLALACEKAQGSWDGVKLTVSHEDVHSLAGTDSSHIALQEGEEVPLTDALYATQMASANDGANLLAEYFGGGTIADGVAKMNAQVRELGLAHTHFANPHGISGDDHYTSCYDMAQILRWALQQPGFETVFTRNEMYTMQPTNLQPVTRYFSQQDKMRIGSSRYHIDGILGSKLGYTNTARYSYACLAEQNGVRLICVTMQSELSTDKYSDVRTLLDDAFATGSSIMPQKKNPDVTELIRGKSGRVFGDLITLLTMMKGLPLAYNKDMQEDKEAIFDAVDTVKLCLSTLIPLLQTMRVNKENMRAAAAKGFINATDCADYLVKKGMPFRDAYKITGQLVAQCIAKQLTLETLPLADYQAASPVFDEDVYQAIALETCVKERKVEGGPSPEAVQKQVDAVKAYRKGC